MENQSLIIGWREMVSLPEWNIEIQAKIDSGAKSSSIDCSDIIELPNNRVKFTVKLSRSGDKGVTLEAPIAQRKKVRSSNGEGNDRLYVETRLNLAGVEKQILVNLACRKAMIHRMLLGRESLHGFLIDCGVDHWVTQKANNNTVQN